MFLSVECQRDRKTARLLSIPTNTKKIKIKKCSVSSMFFSNLKVNLLEITTTSYTEKYQYYSIDYCF